MAPSVADAAVVELSDAVIAIADAVRTASAAQSPPQTPRASSWLPSQSQSPRRLHNRTVDGAGSVADPAVVELSDTVVHVVADAVSIEVSRAIATADAEGVELVAVAVAVTGTPSQPHPDGAGPLHPAVVELSDTVVSCRCRLHRGQPRTPPHAEGVELVAVAVAVTGGDAFTTGHRWRRVRRDPGHRVVRHSRRRRRRALSTSAAQSPLQTPRASLVRRIRLHRHRG